MTNNGLASSLPQAERYQVAPLAVSIMTGGHRNLFIGLPQMRTTMDKRDTQGVRNLATSDVRDGLLLLLRQVIVQVLNYEFILRLYS